MMQGQVVLITGAAKGIGRYAAQTFAAEGARVVINDIAPLDVVSGELREMGVESLAMNADVRNEDEVKRMVDRVVTRFGRIDVLVNNAAIVTHFSWVPRWPRIRDMEKAFWDKVIETNLGGTFLCTKYVLPHMERQQSGHIVNVYGGADPKLMGVGACAYGVSKEAIRKFTQFIAEEERESKICAVIVAPGAAIATEEAPEELRGRLPGPEFVGNFFVLAAQVPMELSGQLLELKDGHIVVVS